MQAIIRQQLELPGLPSASGIEIVGSVAYVIGDDSPFLYCLDARTLGITDRVPLFETTQFDTGRIPKMRKPDLECLTTLTAPTGETGLLICGSGATEQREIGFWVTFSAAGAARVQPLALGGLYAALRGALPAGIPLNLEAVAASATELLLFQRTVGAAGGNLLYRLSLGAAWAFIWGHTAQVPAFGVQDYTLPTIDGQPAGFSGASIFQEQLFITATVEDTLDPVADGAVLGSFVGVLDLAAPPGTAATLTRLQWPDGRPYRGKVESLAVRQQIGPGQWEAVLVTDDDAGGSTAVVVELRV
ncbi:hypothetical protein SAMN02745146_0232 [Hymenobacter daecheongensis DSM 21074]|uniref:Uncharacterized protein n=1 Tax=Hymenobacter daecheongensis DSM 21074 TaxID=1121955 RepID=A0A1M6MD12_9BACT|nr:hypothetical protein [Hymenobacter daecheongensis]SHJ81309.1 hypothetical protein SAMN02745146_0232 [Hymenobacter daecheongensis DSM 21074]